MTISARFLNEVFYESLDKEGGVEKATENARMLLRGLLEEKHPGLHVDDVQLRRVADKTVIDYSVVAVIPRKSKFSWCITDQELLATNEPVTALIAEELEKSVTEMFKEAFKGVES